MKKGKQGTPFKDLIYKVLIFIGAVALIVYFLPRDGKFNYQFDMNRPWRYGQLIATFDFPIYKEKQVIKTEQDSVLTNHFHPYFQKNKDISINAIEKFKEDYHSHLKDRLPSSLYHAYIQKTLQNIYDVGIIPTEDMKYLLKDSVKTIMISEDKLATGKETSKLYTVRTAYEALIKGDSVHFKSEKLKACDLNNYITPNLNFEQERTETAKEELLSGLSLTRGAVLSGQKIIDRGEIVDQKTYNILESLKIESTKRSESVSQKHQILIGQVIFVAIMMLTFMLYIELFRKDFYERKRSLTLLFLIVIFYCIMTALIEDNFLSVYTIPYAMLPIIISVFLDSRTAIVAHTTTILICSIVVSHPHEFILLQFVAGMVAIFSLRELSQRSQLIKSAFVITISYAMVFLALELISESDLSKINIGMYTYFAINGILLLFTYPLLFLLEKTFGFTSNVTLVELSNINNSLLRKMSEVAPGTFQHSMQMANLATEAAMHIGANSQLVRTGALYHDIGKSENPAFFTENQSGGINPHDRLTYEQSAEIVINHVYDGIKLADKNNIPNAVKDFITTHHGKGKTKYFYISWMNEHPGEKPDDAKFTYPGPNPFTKETAILMMADSVEAASRSLPEYTEETISHLVEKIIDTQVEEGYFKECPITFQDIATIKAVFKEKLKIIYHTRISYPELKK
ncbi:MULTISPECIES: HDIG domain-containing metalloprotein [Bacteroides]|nr:MULTISPECIES: HDIG domain-containing metalloprotein [Bacteroides]HJD91626.1 HDIG domain-containing protein [Bacteroides coprosuis]